MMISKPCNQEGFCFFPQVHLMPRKNSTLESVVLIYGLHAVAAALRSPHRKHICLYVTARAAERLKDALAQSSVTTQIVAIETIAQRLPRDAVHQGVLLESTPLAPMSIMDLPEKGLLVVLDQITDPHNVGAIVRTCAAFAVDAIVMPERNAPPLTGILAKAASGGLEHVSIIRIVNLARALEDIRDQGYWCVGLDSQASSILKPTPRPLALILGAEDKGLRRLTREKCDDLARLDLPGAIQSLNVSNACAIALALTS